MSSIIYTTIYNKNQKIKVYGILSYLFECIFDSNQVDLCNSVILICNGVGYWSGVFLVYNLWWKENEQGRWCWLENVRFDCYSPYRIVTYIGIIWISDYLMASGSDAFFYIFLDTFEPILFESFLECRDMSCIYQNNSNFSIVV